jgi:hypothetical protein
MTPLTSTDLCRKSFILAMSLARPPDAQRLHPEVHCDHCHFTRRPLLKSPVDPLAEEWLRASRSQSVQDLSPVVLRAAVE